MGNRGEIGELILHVGLHKTGTTSIQESFSLKDNRKLLEGKGYIYPERWPSNHSIPIYSAFYDHPQEFHINAGLTLDEIKVLNKNYLEQFTLEISERRPRKLIISGEAISVLPDHNLENLKEYLMGFVSRKGSIKVLIYVRNPLSWMASHIQVGIKAGETYHAALRRIESVMPEFPRNFIQQFMHLFEKNSVQIHTFEDAVRHQFGPVGHFLSVLGFEQDEIRQFKMVRANESMSLAAADLISYMNQRVPTFTNGSLDKERFDIDISVLTTIKGPKFDIPYDVKMRVLKNNIHAAQWLKETWGIDYSQNEDLKPEPLVCVFSEETINDIQSVYSRMTDRSKAIVIEYLIEKLNTEWSDAGKLQIAGLINKLRR